ncbi:putative photosynthetic complex assembly protein PuhE [Cognatishimia sp. MH4019]|uniref:putative photosynthetic complex assembly protein PuhE n=1 Tax=Cognatishimia sp. MH4019 TaxID=2854030 RepID=UPI001CD3BE33|nr:putative photosynthetic complex assembly protein PuhE [Cognatishimia sp. MH4019]
MASPWIAAIGALFLWWFSTGAILMVVKRADRADASAHANATLWGLPFLALGIAATVASLEAVTIANVYLGFIAALAIWGWIELAFLTGIITGPIKAPCPAALLGHSRFSRAFGTVAYHEIALLIALVVLWIATAGAENTIAAMTFTVLFLARISAKLNLFYGVPRINTEFLPKPLAHLPSYFRYDTVNGLLPFSIMALGFTTAIFLQGAMSATAPTDQVALALLTSLLGLALLEHLLMVLPLPDAKLWRWMLPAPKPE